MEWEDWMLKKEEALEASQGNDKVAAEVLRDTLSEEEKEELRQQQRQRQEEATKRRVKEASQEAKPDGSHRKEAFKHTLSPEHLKHKQEALAEEASREAKEKKLRALRESAPRFNSPTKAPSGSFENPLTITFPETTPDSSF